MKLHRKSLLLFQLMVIRLMSESDALTLKFLQPLTVDLNAGGSRDTRVVPEDITHMSN